MFKPGFTLIIILLAIIFMCLQHNTSGYDFQSLINKGDAQDGLKGLIYYDEALSDPGIPDEKRYEVNWKKASVYYENGEYTNATNCCIIARGSEVFREIPPCDDTNFNDMVNRGFGPVITKSSHNATLPPKISFISLGSSLKEYNITRLDRNISEQFINISNKSSINEYVSLSGINISDVINSSSRFNIYAEYNATR